MYYVYYAIDKNGNPKVGCTSNPQNRFSRYKESKLLHCYTDAKEAGDKEIELQIKYFGKRDNSKNYSDWLKIRYSNKGIKGSIKGGETTKKLYTKPKKPKLSKEEINKKRISTLKKRHAEGKWDNWDNSFFQSKEYKEKLSKKSLEMWKNPKRKEAQAKGCDVGNAVLSEDDVRFIRKTYFKVVNQYCKVPKGMMSLGKLQQKFNCSKGVILNVVKGKSYTSVK